MGNDVNPDAANPDPAMGRAPTVVSLPVLRRGIRIFLFYSCAVLLTGVVSLMFADLLWRTGWSASRTVLLVLFIILFLLVAIGCVHGLFGFLLRVLGDKARLTGFAEYARMPITGTSTAIIAPIYNEDVARVYEGIRASFESLRHTGRLECFDFYILSDSTDPDKWIEEERRWHGLVRDLGALGRIHYRRRFNNEGKKSGNVRDFLSTWGRRYRYFVCFDADSIMRGETLLRLVQMMEANPQVGLIQTVPGLVNAESLFGRMQQFANRLYAPLFITGLNYWTLSTGNYWGHNAIIRTEPFMQYCDLPQLPGRKPFGGQILSHDFVEAALMLKENWRVWFAYDLEGSYEEGPQGLIENAQRDRRWCQGNLQHGMVLFAKGLRGVSRIHLLLGIFGYLSSPLWLAFMLTYCWMRWSFVMSNLSELPPVQSFWLGALNGTTHAFIIFTICMAALFLPKVLAIVELALDRERRKAFGGLLKVTASAVAETLFSTLHAPLQMLWHTQFVITILMGMGVNWGAQNRGADGTSWLYALRCHWWQVLTGVLWGGLVLWLDPVVFWWFLPVLVGMLLAVPVSVLTNRSALGRQAGNLGLFVTPEETHPPEELAHLRERLWKLQAEGAFEARPANSGLADAVLDPYVNAIHVSFLREKRINPAYAEAMAKIIGDPNQIGTLAEQLLTQGPAALKTPEKIRLLSDPSAMSWLHRQAWLRPSQSLALWWQKAIRRYAR
jgi:membrane glycosyltransferase